MNENWTEEDEVRQQNVLQNGNTGEHYSIIECQKAMSEHANNYDFVVLGKYDTGASVIDCYRLFDGLPKRLPAELEHSVKKILFNGTRGSKDSRKDLIEARNQIDMYLDRVKPD